MTPSPSDIRYRVDPEYLPPEKAARFLHVTLPRFNDLLPELLAAGFPPPNRITGNFDLEAMRLWKKLDNERLYGLTPTPRQLEVVKTQPGSLGDRFAAKKRSGHG